MTGATLDRDTHLRIYRTVSLIRTFDDKARALIAAGQAYFVHYPVRGHEIISAAVNAALEPTDWLTATYRGIADELAKGVDLRELWAEMLGKATGTSKGQGGPMHISAPDKGLMVTTGIVGAGIPIGTGLGLAAKLKGEARVTVCNFGDGATNIGAFHEGINIASVWDLPVVFVCQNNQYGEHTAYEATAKNPTVAERAGAYGMKGVRVDGTDPEAVYLAAVDAVAHARRGDGPVLLECVTFRTLGHVNSDKNEYMDAARLERERANDPVPRYRAWLAAQGVAGEEALAAIDAEVAAAIERAYEQAVADPLADPALLTADVVVPSVRHSEPGEAAQPGEMTTFRQAITRALDEALERDPTVFLMGEDVADSAGGGVFKITTGLSSRHGEDRVRNTPIAEEGFVGAAVGAAIGGLRPVPEVMFFDFIGVCWDQLANHAAKLRFMSGARTPVPLTMRICMMGGNPIGAQHSQSLEALLMHTPGLKVVYPSTPYDAYGLLGACIADDDPCVFVECTALMAKRGPLPSERFMIPIGVADVKKPGNDLTIISYGRLMSDVLKAAEQLDADGVSAEVIDLRTVAPLDMDTILGSVARTTRALVVHEAVRTCGPGAEIATRIHEELHGQLAGPVKRLTAPDSSVPGSAGLVAAFYPNAATITAAAKAMA